MGKKMNLHFPFKSSSQTKPMPPSWPWPSACTTTPKTMSFRDGTTVTTTATTHDIFKTVNSAYLDDFVETPKSCFNGCDAFEESFATAREEENEIEDEDIVETMIRGLKSERLFFEPENKSIVQESGDIDLPPLITESLAMTVDSTDPFTDFKKSMEEMVEAHGLKDNWDCLEELLTCYLKVNCKSNHGYIVGAFVDLLVGLSFNNTSTSNINPSSSTTTTTTNTTTITNHSFTSPLSICSSTFSNSPCLSSSLEVDDEKSVNNNPVTSSSSASSSSPNV